MKMKWVLIASVTLIYFCMNIPAHAEDESLRTQVLNYAGKSYTGIQDPDYLSYDSALREYMVKRIHQRFGVTLDPKTYSGFDLLEIEALLKCKKSEEPADTIFKMFPKYR